jgi:hypothetical protein
MLGVNLVDDGGLVLCRLRQFTPVPLTDILAASA